MEKFRAPFLYTETRLNLDQAYAGSTIDITLSKTGNHERRTYNDITLGSDEAEFAQDHLATDASLFFRNDDRYPRSFLWRVLDDRRALEVQSVDLSQDSTGKERPEAILTLLLRFPAAIRPYCIAFADPDDVDALHVFAVTTTDELWTLTLYKEFFIHTKATETLSRDWCKVTKPSMFSVTTPFRLFASNSRELYVSMIGGQVVRLTRRPGEDGSTWHDTVYSEVRFGASFARALSFRAHPTVRFGGLDIEPSSAISIAPTSFDGDEAHLVTVCLDHTLRIWNLKTGRISAEMDILGDEDQRYFIGASQRQLLQVLDMPGRQEFYAVTYSPKSHQFKFWAIFDPEAGRQGIREMRPEIEYKPPIDAMMDTAVWNLEEFHLRPSRGTKQTELWIRVRSGQASQVFMLRFDPFDFGHKLYEVSSNAVKECWDQQWVAVSRGAQTIESLDKLSPMYSISSMPDAEVAELTQRWLDFLFYPGRFTIPLLEAALNTYITAAVQDRSIQSRGPLKDRMTKAIWASAAKPARNGLHSVGLDAKTCWKNLYSLVRDLYRRRTDAVGFAMDPWDSLPWLVSSDSVAPIKKSSDLDVIQGNCEIVSALYNPRKALYSLDQADNQSRSDSDEDNADNLSGNLYLVAHSFRSPLSAAYQQTLKRAVTVDIIQDPTVSISDRLHKLQEATGLFTHVSEDEESRFDDIVGDFGGYAIFHADNFAELLKMMREPESGRHQEENITRFGAKMLVRSAQETVALNLETLLDLLTIVLYLEGMFEANELVSAIEQLPEDTDQAMDLDRESAVFDAHDLFDKIMRLLRENIILDFLSSNVRKEHTKQRRKSNGDSPVARQTPKPVYSSTLLESMFIGDWPDTRAPEEQTMVEWVDYTARAWLTKLNASEHDEFTAHVLADLIKHGEINLGEQFMPFVPLTGWSSYLQGRLALEAGLNDKAAASFRKAAYAMSMGFFDVSSHDTAQLLRPDQIEKFSDGLPQYYEHVIDLLGQAKANSHVAEFAKLALQAHHKAIQAAEEEAKVENKTMPARAKTENEKRSTELLSRLFTASIQTAHFDDAYMALTRMPATGVRHFCLQQFIQSLVQAGRVKQLFNYPWAQLADEADAELAKQAKKTLSLNAKPEYFKILYAWRIKRNDYRGASQAAFERLERLRAARKDRGADPNDERVVEAYLLLINAMASVGKDEAWVLREPVAEKKGLINGSKKDVKEGRRGLVTLEDVRREYQEELDAIAMMEQGKFAFVENGGEVMDVL